MSTLHVDRRGTPSLYVTEAPSTPTVGMVKSATSEWPLRSAGLPVLDAAFAALALESLSRMAPPTSPYDTPSEASSSLYDDRETHTAYPFTPAARFGRHRSHSEEPPVLDADGSVRRESCDISPEVAPQMLRSRSADAHASYDAPAAGRDNGWSSWYGVGGKGRPRRGLGFKLDG